MDQRAHDVEEDLKHILRTRMALDDKLQLLERQVAELVHGTKAAAFDALDVARNKAAEFIESVTRNLNPSVQAGRRPWIMLGSAVAVGFFAGFIEQRRRTAGIYPYYPPQAASAAVMPSEERGEAKVPSGVYPFYSAQAPRLAGPIEQRPRTRKQDDQGGKGWMTQLSGPLSSLWDELTGELTQERRRVQKAVIHAGRSFVHDVARIAGESLLGQLNRPSTTSQREWRSRTDR